MIVPAIPIPLDTGSGLKRATPPEKLNPRFIAEQVLGENVQPFQVSQFGKAPKFPTIDPTCCAVEFKGTSSVSLGGGASPFTTIVVVFEQPLSSQVVHERLLHWFWFGSFWLWSGAPGLLGSGCAGSGAFGSVGASPGLFGSVGAGPGCGDVPSSEHPVQPHWLWPPPEPPPPPPNPSLKVSPSPSQLSVAQSRPVGSVAPRGLFRTYA
jgi:hypothetical protein